MWHKFCCNPSTPSILSTIQRQKSLSPSGMALPCNKSSIGNACRKFLQVGYGPIRQFCAPKTMQFVARSLFLSLCEIESLVRFLVFLIWLSSTTIWHPQWRGFTCTTSLKKTWNLESPEEDLQICATYRFQGRCLSLLAEWIRRSSGLKGTVVSCTMSECSRFVYYYLSPSSPLPPALTTLLQPAAPVTQAHAWRSGWAPGQMSASPWLVFWASSFFLSCYDNRSLESRICPPWWSTTIWRRIAHTTCIFYGVAPTFPAANVEHFRHLWSKNGYLVNALSFNTQLWWCQGLHPFLKPW